MAVLPFLGPVLMSELFPIKKKILPLLPTRSQVGVDSAVKGNLQVIARFAIGSWERWYHGGRVSHGHMPRSEPGREAADRFQGLVPGLVRGPFRAPPVHVPLAAIIWSVSV